MNPRIRAAAVMTVLTAALATTACGSSSSSSTGYSGSASTGGSVAAKAVAYTQCMRSHGVPAYPDPNSSGDLPKITPGNESQLGVSDSQFTAAGKACESLWPYQAPTPAQEEQELVNDLKFARCMRSHGLANFPDPITNSRGQVLFVFSASRDGFNSQSPQVLAKAHECVSVLPAGSTLPHASDAP